MPATTSSRLCPASRLVEVAPPLRPDLAVLRRLRSAAIQVSRSVAGPVRRAASGTPSTVADACRFSQSRVW